MYYVIRVVPRRRDDGDVVLFCSSDLGTVHTFAVGTIRLRPASRDVQDIQAMFNRRGDRPNECHLGNLGRVFILIIRLIPC